MKIILVIIGSCVFLTSVTCTRETDDEHHHILFCNRSDYDVFVDRSFCHPDTSLLQARDVTTEGWDLKVCSHNSNNNALRSFGTYESKFFSMDTMIVFVFNADTLVVHGWDYVKENNMVVQRYDLSISDLQNIRWRLSFPPTEEMQNIRMWPPYGTYDSSGNIIQ